MELVLVDGAGQVSTVEITLDMELAAVIPLIEAEVSLKYTHAFATFPFPLSGFLIDYI